MRTQLAKTKWRRDFAKQCHYIDVFDPTLGIRIILGPERDELPEVVGPKDRPVPCEVVEVVHDDGHKKVQHDEGAEEDEGHKVDVRDVRAAGLVRVKKQARGLVPLVSSLVTRSPR